MSAPILILAVGNPSRGDDALGPLLAQRLSDWLAQQAPPWAAQIDIVTDQQWMVEHVIDLQGRQRVLFVDASAQQGATPQWHALAPPSASLATQATQAVRISTHSSTPDQLLALYRQLIGAPPPPADLLALPGTRFELGAPLSEPAQVLLEAAWPAMLNWLHSHVPPMQPARHHA